MVSKDSNIQISGLSPSEIYIVFAVTIWESLSGLNIILSDPNIFSGCRKAPDFERAGIQDKSNLEAVGWRKACGISLVENELDKKMDNHIESEFIQRFIRVAKLCLNS